METGYGEFREITIPGDLLADNGISDGAKILYGKISRLAYKSGYCWAGNSFLDGTKTGRKASRQLAELRDAGYVLVSGEGKARKIAVKPVNSRITNNPAPPPLPKGRGRRGEVTGSTSPDLERTSPDLERTSPDLVTNLAKNGDRTALNNITNNKKRNKETEQPKPVSFSENQETQKPKTREDALSVFLKARALWNKRLKPECRDLIIPPAEYDCLRTFQHYSGEEIENAIMNYDWHKSGRCKREWKKYLSPPPYGSLYGFLKTGVARYFDDDALDQQFKEA